MADEENKNVNGPDDQGTAAETDELTVSLPRSSMSMRAINRRARTRSEASALPRPAFLHRGVSHTAAGDLICVRYWRTHGRMKRPTMRSSMVTSFK